MPSLCGYCDGRVPYFGRRFAHHRWFCSRDCLTHWEAEPRDAQAAAQPNVAGRRLPWIAKLLVLLAGIVVLALALGSCIVFLSLVFYDRADVAPGAESPSQADVRNRELMALLPSHPASVVIEEKVWDELCCHPLQRYRLLTHVYASDATLDDVLTFYRQRLTEAGWEDLQEVTGGYGFQKENIYTFITPLRRLPSGGFWGSGLETLEPVSVKSIQAPPADASTFFGVTTKRRIDCLRVDCLRWPTGSQ